MKPQATVLTAALVLGLNQMTLAADWNTLTSAGSQSANWLVYGGDLGNARFVPSDQINTDNVKDLKVKWIFQTGIIGSFEN
ncbi:MAG: hypothetical protein R3202_10365, partial [Candidatus Competibacterales bacterium]|nr:hypothetical protein [Candidatus Competibacterales bacterium]